MDKNNNSEYKLLMKKYKRIKKTLIRFENTANRQIQKILKKYYVGKCFQRNYNDGSCCIFKITDLDTEIFADTALAYGPKITVRSDGSVASNENGTVAIVFTKKLSSYADEEISEQEYHKLVSKILKGNGTEESH